MIRSLRHSPAAVALGAALILGSGGCATAELRKELSAQRGEIEKLRAEVDALRARLPRPATPEVPAADTVYAVPVGDSPVEGPADAWVTIVEFSDFECPFCARVQETLRRVREQYAKNVRFVFKQNPLPMHAQAMPAALAAECARAQGRFWLYAAALFENSRQLEGARLLELAGTVPGMDRGAFEKCVAAGVHRSRIEADQGLARRLGATGTPTFFINGKSFVGAQPLEAFQAAIDAEIATAKASGIPASAYYVRAVLEKGRSGRE